MRKQLSIILVLFVIFNLTGCLNPTKPDSTVISFIEAGKKFDTNKMAEAVNPSKTDNKKKIENLGQNDDDKEKLELDDQYQKYFMDYIKENAEQITYNIKSSTIKEDSATINVEFEYLNGGPVLKAAIGEAFSQLVPMAFSGMEVSEEDSAQIFLSALKDKQENIEETFTKKTLDIKLVKVDNKWYIDEPIDELLDVVTSNFISAAREIDESFNSLNDMFD